MVAICTPTRGDVKATFYMDMVQLLQYSKRPIVPCVVIGSNLTEQRNSLAKAAFDNRCSHILWIDSDQRFPVDTVERLMSHNKAIVGANIKQRVANLPTARKDGKWVESDGKTGIEKVDTIGCGITLVSCEVLGRILQPWYLMPWDDINNKVVGEDVYFCIKAKKYGFDTWVDHDLSKLVKHTCEIEK